MKILVINCGSSSLKYQLFDMDGEKVLAKGICEAIGTNKSSAKGSSANGAEFKKVVDIPDHRVAFGIVKDALTSGDTKVIDRLDEIGAIGHRVVQGGDLFTESTLVTDKVVEGIKSLIPLAPLHNAAHITGIECCTEVFGKDVPQVTVFDNAFHSTMPPTSYLFALPYEYYENDHVRRYGAHGTSHRFVAYRAAELMGKDLKDFKLITCHLGNGASITAIKDGKVLDTSMGLTPLDGFMMGTRCGGVDPSAVTFIMDKHNISPKEMDTIMNKKSGVLGISGVHSDDRVVKQAAKDGNARAKLARDMQWYQIRKYIGSYVAAMDGVDCIVFTGGIGENCDDLRADVCKNLSFLGIKIDEQLNASIHGDEAELTLPGCKVRVFVIPTNEELAIARDTKAIAEAL
ncbi:MAG: acetate kinase [Oscillospiraceae bacterium]|nr:acetate kinase [Oscillospiraceae bacterium]